MNELTSLNPNCRKRLALLLGILVLAVTAFGTAHWLTRPPELVWWTSPPIGDSGLRLRVIVPNGWAVSPSPNNPSKANSAPGHRPEWAYWFQLSPVDRTPSFLRWIFPRKPEQADLTIIFGQPRNKDFEWTLYGPKIQKFDALPFHCCIKYALRREANTWAYMEYRRTNLPAFNATYKQICNSLRIE